MQKTLINSNEVANVKNFGVELELNVDKDLLIQALHLKGINCSYEGYTHAVTTGWKIVTDSSIRGTNCYELVSPILNGVAGLKQLREVCLALYFVDAKVNKSCGVHVHHETLGLTEQQKTNLMHFYARMERTIDAMLPLSRKRNENQYCCSMVNAYINCRQYSQLDSLGKYYKLNFNKLNTYGTLEFRQHSGTIEFEKIYHWIVFTANFRTFCKDKRSRGTMNYIERAWTKKHLKLSDRTWKFCKDRMKVNDDLARIEQNVPATIESLMVNGDRSAQAA